jgi:DNA polymerase
VDLKLSGSHAYAEHPDTQITVLCYAIDQGPVQTWTHGEPMDDFVDAIDLGATTVAHNYLFEFNLYHRKLVPFGWPEIPLAQWSCTMARALVAGYPASLEQISRAARLAIPKDTSARDLVLRMARPRTRSPLTWWHETSPEHFARLCAYCATDVEAERLLDQQLPELSARERAIFEADFAINQLGIRVDAQLVRQLHALAGEAKVKFTQDIVRLTNGQVSSPAQVARLRDWLAFMGVDTPDLRRGTVARLVKHTSGAAQGTLQARLDASRSSTAKLDAILSARSRDGRVHGTFQYYGASRTGRWAGRRLQPQNLFRGSIKDVNAALRIIRQGTCPEDLEALFEDTAMGVIASCLRSTIQAPRDHTLVVMDFSQIEARVLAWLADETASLRTFRAGQDIYEETAKRVGSTNRQLGKVLVLACGYGMGPGRFGETAQTFGLELSEYECADLVAAWREANENIVAFWWDCEKAMKFVCRNRPGTVTHVGRCAFIRRADSCLIRLPSGRHLVYRRPSIQWNEENKREQFTYMGSFGGAWVPQRAWPGKIVENITQAAARDVMADAMVTLHQRRVPLIATVHDELIAEVPETEAEDTYAVMKRVMCATPVWAPGLPMSADGFIARRYQKK